MNEVDKYILDVTIKALDQEVLVEFSDLKKCDLVITQIESMNDFAEYDIFIKLKEFLGKHSRNLGYSKFHVANGFARCSNSRDERVRILDYVSKSKIYIPKDIFLIKKLYVLFYF